MAVKQRQVISTDREALLYYVQVNYQLRNGWSPGHERKLLAWCQYIDDVRLPRIVEHCVNPGNDATKIISLTAQIARECKGCGGQIDLMNAEARIAGEDGDKTN